MVKVRVLSMRNLANTLTPHTQGAYTKQSQILRPWTAPGGVLRVPNYEMKPNLALLSSQRGGR